MQQCCKIRKKSAVFFSVKSISRNFSWNRFQFRVEMEWIVLLHIRSRYTNFYNFYNLHNFSIFRTLMKLATDRKSKELPAMSSIRALSKNMCSLIYFKSFTTKFKFDIEISKKNPQKVLCLCLFNDACWWGYDSFVKCQNYLLKKCVYMIYFILIVKVS